MQRRFAVLIQSHLNIPPDTIFTRIESDLLGPVVPPDSIPLQYNYAILENTPVLWLSLAAVIVLLVPGGALLAWLGSNSRRDSNPRWPDALVGIADAAALSIALSTLLALGLFVLKIRLTSPVVFGIYGICLVLLVFGLLRRMRSGGTRLASTAWRWGISTLFASIVIAAIVAWRLYQARTLVLPAWVDSVHHTLIVRMISDYGGIPPDFSPYIPAPFSYHFGFHLIAALFNAWTNLSPDQAVLWFGQVVNAAVCFSVYRAARALQSRLVVADEARPFLDYSGASPLLAALLTGFVLQMPAYYLTWGRYTLLTGLALVGPAIAAALEAWDDPASWRSWLRFGLLLAGLALSHYFALLLVALFLLVMGLFGLVRWLRRRAGWSFLWRLALVSFLALLVVSPWLWRVVQYSWESAAVQFVDPLEGSATSREATTSYFQYLLYLIGPRRGYILMGAAGIGALFALRRYRTRMLVGWALLLLLFALPWGLRFNPFRPDHFAIILFFPVALLLADLLVDGASSLAVLTRRWAGAAALALVTGLLLIWGIRETSNILNPVTVLTTQADVNGLEWVKKNTPQTARFYINSVMWQAQTYRGVDGGYWLEPYTQRASLLPPVFYTSGPADYFAQINRWSRASAQLKGCTADFWDLVREANLSYVYLRQGSGSLQPSGLTNCAGLRVVYQQDGVFIYEILSPH